MNTVITKTIKQVIEELKYDYPNYIEGFIGKPKSKSTLSELVTSALKYAEKHNYKFIQFVEPKYYIFLNENRI